MLVAALARREDKLVELCDEINAKAGEKRAVAYPHDVTKIESIPPLFQRILADLGGIDILAYVAGTTIPVALDEFDLAKEQQMLEVNLLGGVAWLGQASTLFQRMGQGQIVGISSVAADACGANGAGYVASKAAVNALTKMVARENAAENIRCNIISPGLVMTDMGQALLEAHGEKLVRDIPLGRLGTPEEIGRLAVYLASDDADWITGKNFRIDGGQW